MIRKQKVDIILADIFKSISVYYSDVLIRDFTVIPIITLDMYR